MEQLDARQIEFLRLVYREFARSGQWPTGTFLQKLVWRTGLDVEDAAASLPEDAAIRDYSLGGAIRLKLPGLIACGDADGDLKNFIGALRLLVGRLDDPAPQISTADMAQHLSMDEAAIRRLRAILEGEYVLVLAAESDRDGRPYVWKASDEAWRFAAVQSPEDYVRAKKAYLERPRARAPARSPLVGDVDSEIAEQGQPSLPREVFVAYPWSAYPDRSAYKAAYTAIEDELMVKFVFAESRLSERHVLEKIEAMIKGTALGIYDLTKWNPNVSLEYGYARGLGKDAFIAFNPSIGESTDVPADIRGYDRIQYENLTDLTREVRRLVIQQIGPPASRGD